MSGSRLMEALVTELEKLPGVGRRSAERIAYHLMVIPPERALPLAEAIMKLGTQLHHCRTCFNLSDTDPCGICEDDSRDKELLCVVEHPRDLQKIERSGSFKGLYHVLTGTLSPLDGVNEEHLTLRQLAKRVKGGSFREIVLGTGANLDGEGTALYVMDMLQDFKGQVTRLARGLPSGSKLDDTSEAVVHDAMEGRRPMKRGQVLTEYALALVLASLLVLSALGPGLPDSLRDLLSESMQSRETQWSYPIP